MSGESGPFIPRYGESLMYRAGDYSIDQEFHWIGDWVGKRAMLTPHKEAIFDNITKKRYSFKDLNLRANKLARVLVKQGVAKGDRVAMFSSNRIECVDLFLATGKIGAIFVPFNIRLSISETEYLIKKTKPSLFFYDPALESKVLEIKETRLFKETIAMGDKTLENDARTTRLMNEVPDSSLERPPLNLEDPHLILFTGGTTGLPKGAVLPQR
jgi:fatty-acyl-CoA synthase